MLFLLLVLTNAVSGQMNLPPHCQGKATSASTSKLCEFTQNKSDLTIYLPDALSALQWYFLLLYYNDSILKRFMQDFLWVSSPFVDLFYVGQSGIGITSFRTAGWVAGMIRIQTGRICLYSWMLIERFFKVAVFLLLPVPWMTRI